MDPLRCVVERITYQNAENGFSVIKCRAKGFQDLVTVIGNMPDVHVGSVLTMQGQWRIDGKQTPMKGHPVFIAQHATATCCRGCLEKWHRIPKGAELTTEQQEYPFDIPMECGGRQPTIEKGLP